MAIPFIQGAYNKISHSLTGYSPFYQCYGIEDTSTIDQIVEIQKKSFQPTRIVALKELIKARELIK